MKTYLLSYHSDGDDSCPTTFKSATEVLIGDVILVDNDMYHCVYGRTIEPEGVTLDLAQSATCPAEARLIAEQDGLYSTSGKPHAQQLPG